MLTFTEAQLMGWASPLLWPFLRVLALFSAMPVLGPRGGVPARVRVALAVLVTVAAQASLPAMAPLPVEGAHVFLTVVQQLVIGLTLGFAVRLVFAAIEFAGEVVGLQMGLNFAGFFDPVAGGQGTATSRFLGTLVAMLFVAINGHLLVIAALVQSFHAFPVGEAPLDLLRLTEPHRWGAEVFSLGLWLALPMVGMLLFVNLVLGVISRVAQQLNIFSIGFPITLGVGLVGLGVTLPLLQAPFVMALERMLQRFQ